MPFRAVEGRLPDTRLCLFLTHKIDTPARSHFSDFGDLPAAPDARPDATGGLPRSPQVRPMPAWKLGRDRRRFRLGLVGPSTYSFDVQYSKLTVLVRG
jgi:hypothetical protein